MTNHTELLNLLAEKINAKSYLEIGCFNLDHNFNKISVPVKIGVDPDPNAGAGCKMTSDEYFSLFDKKFDLIFIDGLHEAEQVKRDIINSFANLNEGGVIVLHDCNPPTEQTACYPRGTQREWCGNVYKTICQLKSPKITIDFDYGCCILKKSDGPLQWENGDITWEEFDLFRKELLNLASVEDALKIFDIAFNKKMEYAHV